MNNRISYQPWDFKEVPLDEIKPKELLIDYTNNDIIIVNDDKKVFKFKDYLKNQLSNTLNSSHMKLSDQHTVATSEHNGFMSAQDKANLDKMVDKFNEVGALLNNNLRSKYKIKNLIYDIAYGNVVSIKCDLQFGPLLFKLNSLIDVDNRPANKYRDDLICIVNKNDELGFQFMKSTELNINEIQFEGITYVYNKNYNYYEYNDNYIIPILKIRRLNDEYISSDNVFGKINDELLTMSEIYKIKEHNNKYKKILKTNLSVDKYIDKDVIYFLPLNGNDIEQVTHMSINKNSYFTSSPYGKMHMGSFNVGTILPIEQVNSFVLEFMIKSNTKSDNIITLFDGKFNDVYNIKVTENKLIFKSNNEYHRVNLDTKHIYNVIRLVVNDTCKVYINDVLSAEFNKNNTTVKNVRFDATNINIGNIIISKNLNFSTNIISDTVEIIDSFNKLSKEDSFKTIEKNIKLSNSNECFKLDKSDISRISCNDKISLFIEDDVVTTYDFSCSNSIVDIKGNIITLKKDMNIEIGQVIKIISDKLDNYSENYIVEDKFNDKILVLDKCVSSEFIGYSVFDINDGEYVDININGEPLKDISIYNNILTATFKDDYELSSNLTLKYTIKEKNNILNDIKNIENVLFDDATSTIYNELPICQMSNTLIPIKINNIEYNDVDKLMYIDKNDEIVADINVNVRDFINTKNYEFLDSKFILNLSSGSNNIEINGDKYNRGNVVSAYVHDTDIINNIASIKMITRTEKTNAKLYLDSYTYILKFKGDINFILRDEYGRISEYLVFYNNALYTNTNKELSIIYGGDI